MVVNYTQTNNYYRPNTLYQNIAPQNVFLSTPSNTFNYNPEDDGVISFDEKLLSFGNGIVKSIKDIIKGIFTTEGIVGIAVFTVLGKIPHVKYVALGIASALGAACGIGKLIGGISKASSATKDIEAKAAWEDIGGGTFASTSSLLFLNSSLRGIKRSGTIDNKFSFKNLSKNMKKGFGEFAGSIKKGLGIGNKPTEVAEQKPIEQPAPKEKPQEVKKSQPPEKVEQKPTEQPAPRKTTPPAVKENTPQRQGPSTDSSKPYNNTNKRRPTSSAIEEAEPQTVDVGNTSEPVNAAPYNSYMRNLYKDPPKLDEKAAQEVADLFGYTDDVLSDARNALDVLPDNSDAFSFFMETHGPGDFKPKELEELVEVVEGLGERYEGIKSEFKAWRGAATSL